MYKLFFLGVILFGFLEAKNISSFHNKETIPVSKTMFRVVNGYQNTYVDLYRKKFIVVSVSEAGSDGRFYAVDVDGTVWWSGKIASGTQLFKTPSGIFKIFQKKRYHMSLTYPELNGVNNMDYMMKFTKHGHALHLGDTKWLSHGCIHIDKKDVPAIYRWSDYATRVIITRHSYMPFAREDMYKIYKDESL